VPPPAELAEADQLRAYFKALCRELVERGEAWKYVAALNHLAANVARVALTRDGGTILVFWRSRQVQPFGPSVFEILPPPGGRRIRHLFGDGRPTSFFSIRKPRFEGRVR
jgi:hypothetical protein